MINDKAVQNLIKLDLIGKIPTLQNTKTSRTSDIIDEKFAELLASMGKAILNRGTKTTIEEQKKLYKLFHSHIAHDYLLGQKYTQNAQGTDRLITKDQLERIQVLTRQSLARWLSKIEGSL